MGDDVRTGKLPVLSITLFLLSSSLVLAAEDPGSGAYAGAGVGSLDFSAEVVPPVFVGIPEDPAGGLRSGDFSDTASFAKLYGGYAFSSYVALEVSYGVADVSKELNLLVVEGEEFPFAVQTDLAVVTVRAIGSLPMSWGSLFAGAEWVSVDADRWSMQFSGGPTLAANDVSDSGYGLLLGVQKDLGPIVLRFEYEDVNMEEVDASTAVLGVSYRF